VQPGRSAGCRRGSEASGTMETGGNDAVHSPSHSRRSSDQAHAWVVRVPATGRRVGPPLTEPDKPISAVGLGCAWGRRGVTVPRVLEPSNPSPALPPRLQESNAQKQDATPQGSPKQNHPMLRGGEGGRGVDQAVGRGHGGGGSGAARTRTHTHTHTHTRTHTHIHTHTHAHTRTRTHTHIHAHTQHHICAWRHT
jgi:hypothetical protein